MNQKEIQELIKSVAKAGVTEVRIEKKDFKITIKSAPASSGEPEEKVVYIQPQVQTPMPMPQQVAAPVVPQQAPQAAPVVEAAPPAEQAAALDESKYIIVKSPMIGTFYRASAPDKPPLTEVGNTIKPGDAVCVIEAMKLFNEIESEVSGTVVKVLVDDASPVEYDQPLFLVDPS